jgi:hypothetical protein
MVSNINSLYLSHNGQYIMYENSLYDVSRDITLTISNTDISFWLNFLKENSKQSYNNKVNDFLSIQKIIRETTYTISQIFDEKNKQLFILEFEKKFSNKLISENFDINLNIENISSSWDYIIESVSNYMFITEQSEEKGLLGKITDKVTSATDWLASKGVGWFFENLRKALFSWGGAAVQTFLATSTLGVGNIVLVTVWGAMLAWDLLQGVKGNWDWVNIIIDLVGVVTTGPGAKIIGGIFQKLGLIGSKLPLSGIMQKLSTSGSSTVKWFSSILSKIVSGLSQIGNYMLQGVSWLSKKIGIKSLDKVTNQLTSTLKNATNDILKSSKSLTGTIGQGLSKSGSKIGQALTSRTGQVATAAGLTATANTAFGADNRALGGAFSNDDEMIVNQLASSNVGYDVNLLP